MPPRQTLRVGFNVAIPLHLATKKQFSNYVRRDFIENAARFFAKVDLDDRNLAHAHDRFISIYNSFANSLKDSKIPNQYKIGSAVCFSLRRSRPIKEVRSFNKYEIAAHFSRHDGNPTAEDDKIVDRRFLATFIPLADEICAFQLGAFVIQYYNAQKEIKNSWPNCDKLEILGAHKPRISDASYRDILVVLRDHATSPFSILTLFDAIFSPVVKERLRS